MNARYVFILGTLPFIVLGAIHIVYTLLDLRAPRRLVPYDDQVRVSMQRTTLALTKQTTMWRAWVGFNLSHGIGVLFFGVVFLILALADFSLVQRVTPLPCLAVALAVAYFLLSVKYWFHIPAIGSGVGAACFLLALFLV